LNAKYPPRARRIAKILSNQSAQKAGISENNNPLCLDGQVEIEFDGPFRTTMNENKSLESNGIHFQKDIAKCPMKTHP
jgi:hypothetical protein